MIKTRLFAAVMAVTFATGLVAMSLVTIDVAQAASKNIGGGPGNSGPGDKNPPGNDPGGKPPGNPSGTQGPGNSGK